MRSPGLVLMGLIAVAVIGYAVYTLISLDPARSRPASMVHAGDEPAVAADDRDGSRPAPQGVKPAAVTRQGDARTRPTPGPPPRPEPSIPVAQARKELAEFLVLLDDLAAKDTKLSSPQWVDYYKRGHDHLQPLLQGLDVKVPEEAAELQKANEDMRTKLWKLQPREPGATPQ